jgi:REP element-mobilizing transposase RayT
VESLTDVNRVLRYGIMRGRRRFATSASGRCAALRTQRQALWQRLLHPIASLNGLAGSNYRKKSQSLLDDANAILYSMRIFHGDSPMTMPRGQLIDVSLTRWYHCVSRCVRRAFLLSEGKTNRKQWVEDRLEELAHIFAVGIGGFSVMDNHLHVLLRLDPDAARAWSNEEVVRRWGRLFPPRDRSGQPLPTPEDWVQGKLKDLPWVAKTRERLQSISWFMKCLKEPLSRLANREDKARGAFFESRFRSVAILDEESLLAISAYVDLNPVAAKIADTPEASEYTSIKARVEHVEAQGQTARLEAAASGSVAGSRAASGLEETLWLCPIEDRRRLDSTREGMFDGLSLGSYLLLVDYSGRLFRQGKAAISAELAGIFDRLGSPAESWQVRMAKLRKGQWFGRFFAASREKLEEVSRRLNVVRVGNLAGCPAR